MASQSTRRMAVMTAIQTHYLTNNNATILPDADMALVFYSPLIAGALLLTMMGIITGVILLMREKRRRIQEAVNLNNLPWIGSLEVYTLTGTDAATGMFLPPITPPQQQQPPPYDSVVTNEKEKEARKEAAATVNETSKEPEEENDDPEKKNDLPTYEAAVRMDGNM